jgi:hypothetical protein
MRRSLSALTVALLALQAPALQVRMAYGTMFSAPATVTIQVTIERDIRNRMLKISVTSDSFYAQSDQALDGTKAARTRLIVWRDLPGGEYDVLAVVERQSAPPVLASTRFRVIGRDEL